MKSSNKIFALIAVMMIAFIGLPSCVSENPFSDEGKVLVKMNVMVNPAVTRATPDNNQALLDSCVVYISGVSTDDNTTEGLLHKWKGVENIPSEIYMRYGSYVAEAWSGDSVTASYESENKKFYKGVEPFSVDGSSPNVQVNLRCTLANVVASVDQATVDSKYIKDVKVTFANSRGDLSFDSENWSDKGYFMMPDNDTELNYTVEFNNVKGQEFKREGIISDVKSAHEYRLKFEYNPAEPTEGGAFVQIVVDETEVTDEQDVYFLGGPEFYWVEDDVEVGEQIIGVPGEFFTHFLRVAGFGDELKGFESIKVSPVDVEMFKDVMPSNGSNYSFDIVTVTEKDNTFKPKLEKVGIEIIKYDPELMEDLGNNIYLHKFVLELSDKWLNSLPASDKPYELTVTATDLFGKINETVISIANTNKAIAKSAPVEVDIESLKGDLLAIGAKSVTLPLTYEDNADLSNSAIQYRIKGTSEWVTQPLNLSNTSISSSVKISNLTPGATYEYRTVGGEVVNEEYELKSKIFEFTTESVFSIPNASFEDWSSYSASTMLGTKTVILPAATGNKESSFWCSGNEGAATAGKVLTNKSEDMVHSGKYSARLASDEAVGIIAAGNIFTGYYVKTDGTNGVLSVGRQYNGSHPSKLKVWANYRPGSGVSVMKGNEQFVPTNFMEGNDHGQIYVALTTEAIEIRTNPNNRHLFDKDEEVVLAYGEMTWTDAFGPEGSLQEVEIPLTYKTNAKTTKPTHLVIVVSASKYGDYFSGSKSSVMYLDDFELVYE